MLLWCLWLRRGRIGVLSQGLKAFDQLDKPARRLRLDRPLISAGFAVLTVSALVLAERRAEAAKVARAPHPSQRADETGNTLSGETKGNAASDKEKQEGSPANQPAPGDDHKVPKNDKD